MSVKDIYDQNDHRIKLGPDFNGRYKYFREDDLYYVYDTKIVEALKINDIHSDNNHILKVFTTKQWQLMLDYLKNINPIKPSKIKKVRSMGCDINNCSNRGINNLYEHDVMIGKYCDGCLSKVKGHYPDAVIIRYPRIGTAEHRAHVITKKLQENGINATQKREGVMFVIDDTKFNKEAIIEVLANY